MRRPLTALVVALAAGCGGEGLADVTVIDASSDPSPVVVVQPVLDADGDEVARAATAVVPRPEPAELVSGVATAIRPTSVAVVGDSLALSAQEQIAGELESAGLEIVAIDAVESRRIARGGSALPPGVDAVETILGGDDQPELWVIALGTNDVGAQASIDAFREDVGTLIALLPEDVPIVWVDLWIRDRSDDIVVANREIRSMLEDRFGVSIVVDWHSQALDPGVITGDGVHLTDAGRELFAASIVDAVDEFFPAG